jgi:hypothetical protein
MIVHVSKALCRINPIIINYLFYDDWAIFDQGSIFNKRYYEAFKLRIPGALFYLITSLNSIPVICSDQTWILTEIMHFLSVRQVVHSGT